ncbi:maleylpyruvate isomerase family mycothiol-dependent enzyme [Aeromicrobium sp. S22]|uniref:maleylpyruvate isomerase family mycothiol-dependent enzyme n=1 Tax=Aeromicrobium sp. S22 TaxID=2662029 RepID=UPI00129D537E|nr:maleylpyruvate isomerase family mycothiol-dependent enzyme [Aeromicrobium sp. S22]MRK00575.1 maleylpyruvate isomerase family mycothiol-dependent enzyme [Aeromicrobium sp. S22]
MTQRPGGQIDVFGELGAATSRFADLVGEATGDEAVPACEGWTVRDLAVHLGAIHRWAAAIVIGGQRVPEPTPLIAGPIASWYAGTAEALLAVLRAVSPDEIVPNFSRIDETAAFWPRRQLHETTVHVVDLQQALGHGAGQWAVPAQIAADGIDEVLRIFFPRLTAGGRRPDVRSRIRFVAADLDRSWIIAPGEGESGPPVQLPPTAEADAVVTGSASDLYLALWHRVPPESLQFQGDDGLALLTGRTTP